MNLGQENQPPPGEEDDKPFFKKLRFWAHIFITAAFLIAGEYRRYKAENQPISSGTEAGPVKEAPSPTGAPTVWSLQVQAAATHETLLAEVEDRKILSANVEEYRRENHQDLAALSDEVKGLRKDVQDLVEMERSRPKTVSILDKVNSKKEN